MFEIADYASGAAALFSRGSGRVHSVYRSTVNLECAGALYALQPSSAPRTPISLSVDVPAEEFSLLRLGRGDPVTCGETLRVGAYLFRASGAAERDHRLRRRGRAGDATLAALRSVLRREIAAERGRSDFADAALHLESGDDASRCRQLSAKGALGFFRAARAGECAAAAVECASLIGLGAGLTPAGDDFNVGVLAVSWYLESARSRELRGALSREAGRLARGTTDVSRAFLLSAAAGEFSSPLLGLFEPGADGEALTGAVRAAMAVGHSSGLDTLCGVLLAAEALEGEADLHQQIHVDINGGSQNDCLQ